MLAKITRIKDGKWISLSDCIRMNVDNNILELIFTLNSSIECGSTLYLMELENYIYTKEGFETIVLPLSEYEIVIDNAQELKESAK